MAHLGEGSGGQPKSRDKGKGAGAYLISLWPALPYLGFGFCAAWSALAHGTVWLSPNETTGGALTNFLTNIYMAMGILLVCIGFFLVRGHGACGSYAGRIASVLTNSRVTTCAGVLASFASLVMLLIGPSYLQQTLGETTHLLFQVMSIIIGLSFGILYLRFGEIYAKLPLRRAILYLCYSHLLAIFVYLAIQVSPNWAPAANSPSLIFMIAFIILPVCSSLTLRLDPKANPWFNAGDSDNRPVEVDSTPPRPWPMTFFALALLLFAFVQSAVSSSVTNLIAPSYTMSSENVVMLIRVPVILGFALLASTIEASRLNFGRLLVVLVTMLEVIVLLGLVISFSQTAWLIPVRSVVFCFEILTWCMIFAVANCHQRQAIAIVAFDFGAYALGTGLGTTAGVQLLSTWGETPLLITCALLLVPCYLLLDGRNVEGLFVSQDGKGQSLEDVLGKRLQPNAPHAKGDFRRRLDRYAADKGLSTREAETLGYLVAGRGDSQIAEAMGISYNTARTHVRNVYNKLGVHDRQTLIDEINKELR